MVTYVNCNGNCNKCGNYFYLKCRFEGFNRNELKYILCIDDPLVNRIDPITLKPIESTS